MMIDNNLLQGIVTVVITSTTGAIVASILRYFDKLAARNIRFWLVGVILVVLTTGLLYGASLEKISFLWVFAGLLITIFSYGIYKRYFDFPFREWRVNNNRAKDNFLLKNHKSNPGLISTRPGLDSMPNGKAWMFKTNKTERAVFGPYIAELGKGRYRAVFKIKILGSVGRSPRSSILTLDVASFGRQRLGGNIITQKDIAPDDFKGANKYRKFPIEFNLLNKESKVELRIQSLGPDNPNDEIYIVILDYIKLSRRFP